MNIYIHIPFCSRLCSYCTFSKVKSGDKELHKKYFEVLKKEMLLRSESLDNKNIKTLYFGGGTPSLVSPKVMGDFFSFLRSHFQISENIEITLECHPATVTEEKARLWEELGITRLSLGVQSFLKKFDDFLERDLSHTIQALETLEKRKYDLSVDLIFGYPEQTKDDLFKDLEMISKFNIDHISYYALDYKVHSKIESKQDKRLPFKTLQEYYHNICSYLKTKGFEQYEIYNFFKNSKGVHAPVIPDLIRDPCKQLSFSDIEVLDPRLRGDDKGKRRNMKSQHNLDFWRQKDYLGFGLSSASYINKTIRENTHNLSQYLQGNFLEDEYSLSSEEYFEQYLKRALRLNEGVCLQELKRYFGERKKDEVLEKAQSAQSWFECSNKNICLREEGKMNFLESIGLLCL